MRGLPIVLATCLGLLGPHKVRAADDALSLIFVGDIMLDGGPGHIVTTGGDPFAAVASALADPPQPMFRVNGKPAIGLAIAMRNGGDVLALGRNVTQAIKEAMLADIEQFGLPSAIGKGSSSGRPPPSTATVNRRENRE